MAETLNTSLFLAQFARLTDISEELSRPLFWEDIPAKAEAHGLGPLLYTHLRSADLSPPPAINQALQGIYLRHRHASQVRTRILTEIAAAYRQANIEMLLIKGAALAHLIYPTPALRPMRDLDILVKKSQVRQAQQLLTELGFRAPLPAGDHLPSKHLPAATRQLEGLSMSVEIHHNLFHHTGPFSMTLETLTVPPCPLSLKGAMAQTLGYEDMLWHLCRHIINIAQPCRLIWVTDIVSFAEQFRTKIDWERMAHLYPLVLNTLSLFHFITPLSPTLCQQASLIIGRSPAGLLQDFQGWPRYSVAAQRHKSYPRLLTDTLFPSEWWLRLHYGLGSRSPLFWSRWGQHPLQLLRWLIQLWREA